MQRALERGHLVVALRASKLRGGFALTVGVEERPDVEQAGWIGQLSGGGVPLGERHRVVSGIGFLGGGAILRYGVTVRGVTTAAALWISAAIGMAAAAGFYAGAVATTAIALVALVALRRLKPVVSQAAIRRRDA